MSQLLPKSHSKMKTQAVYDRLSGWYDWLAGSEEAFKRRGLETLRISPGECVLEIGFGTGKSLAALAGMNARVAGIDLSFGMARVARARLLKKGSNSLVSLNVGSALDLPYPANCFDAVFIAFTLELFDMPEIPEVLDEIRRVLRPGGRLGIVSLSSPEKPGMMVRIYDWFHGLLPDLVDCRPIPVVELVSQNGFQVCHAECKNMWGLPVEMLVARL